MIQMLQLVVKDFNISIINVLKKKMNEQIENFDRELESIIKRKQIDSLELKNVFEINIGWA